MELISIPAERFGNPFTPEEIQQILQLGGHHPFFLQLACYHMFNLKAQRAQGSANFAKLELEFRCEATPHLKYLLRCLTEAERRALSSYVGSGILPEGNAQAGLLRKGILINGPGGLRLFSSTFGDVVRSVESPTSSKTPNLRGILGNLMD